MKKTLIAFTLVLLTSCSGGVADMLSGATHYEKDAVSGKTLGHNSDLEKRIAQLTNDERAKLGKSPLKLVSFLNVAAQKHALNMARQNNMSHELDGKSAQERIDETGYQWNGWGENIANGYKTAEKVMAGWMSSPGHKANILDTEDVGTTQIGVGVAKAEDGTFYYCQVFGRPASNTDYD